jgi:hypothetical protein
MRTRFYRRQPRRPEWDYLLIRPRQKAAVSKEPNGRNAILGRQRTHQQKDTFAAREALGNQRFIGIFNRWFAPCNTPIEPHDRLRALSP